ncbi:MAG: hypothetical protein E3K32_01235 [wastewater metagenome]|nr:hypothetical protein [Candidatus Loosdrechtia aerotolerans]
MDLLTKNDLKMLMERREGPCVSIFMPTHRTWPETQQEPIRLKNLLRTAEEYLIREGLRAPEARKFVEPPHVFFTDTSFWRSQSDGLALFLSPHIFHYYRLPLKFKELLVVTNRFNIKPLLPLLSSNGRFFILALSQNKIGLFQGTHYSITEVDLDGDKVPPSISEALRFTDIEKQLQFHTRATPFAGESPGVTDRAGMFFGQREDIDKARKRILEYFTKVDKGLHELLRNEKAPLVLAGVDYLLPIYREVNSYHYLMEKGIIGSPKETSEKDLHKKSWDIVQSYFQQEREDAAAKYKQFANTEHTSHDIKDVVFAAYHGRIESLFVAVEIQQWGRFNPDTNEVLLHQKEEAGDEDLLDFAAIHTLLNGGAVYAVEPENVPAASLVAAVFRY